MLRAIRFHLDENCSHAIAVYGLFMAPIGWDRALLVWGYALAWFLVNDRLKLIAYRIFDPEQHNLLRSS